MANKLISNVPLINQYTTTVKYDQALPYLMPKDDNTLGHQSQNTYFSIAQQNCQEAEYPTTDIRTWFE